MNFTSETAGLVSQNRLTEELDFDGSGDSNKEEHQKTDYAVVDYSDAPVDKSPHKRAWISGLADYNGKPMPEGINIWWYSSEEKIFFCTEPNQSAYSDVQSQIYMLENILPHMNPTRMILR